jgi:hypothetical protein
MHRQKIFNVLAVVSTTGILGWMLTDYFGGMIIYLFSYGHIIIPIIILYVVSFVDTFISAVNKGMKQNKIKVFFHGLVLLAIILTNLFHSDLFKSERIMTATLKDDLFYYTLVFRENGTCENQVLGMFGFQEVFYGKYQFYGDTIVFTKKPYDNDFIPDTMLINKKEKAIFINKDKHGQFNTAKEWLNYFEIQ